MYNTSGLNAKIVILCTSYPLTPEVRIANMCCILIHRDFTAGSLLWSCYSAVVDIFVCPILFFRPISTWSYSAIYVLRTPSTICKRITPTPGTMHKITKYTFLNCSLVVQDDSFTNNISCQQLSTDIGSSDHRFWPRDEMTTRSRHVELHVSVEMSLLHDSVVSSCYSLLSLVVRYPLVLCCRPLSVC